MPLFKDSGSNRGENAMGEALRIGLGQRKISVSIRPEGRVGGKNVAREQVEPIA